MKSEIEKLVSAERLLAVLRHRKGPACGATASQLVAELTGRSSYGAAERHLRTVVEQLRLEGYPVCAHPAHGYYMAAGEADLDLTCDYLRSRAMKSLQQIAAMRRVSLPDLLGQLRLSA
jgi:acetolactate synthase regulatory subunit